MEWGVFIALSKLTKDKYVKVTSNYIRLRPQSMISYENYIFIRPIKRKQIIHPFITTSGMIHLVHFLVLFFFFFKNLCSVYHI